MPFAPDTPIKETLVLIVSKEHERFGKIGKVIFHDWKEYGVYCVEFDDGKREDIPDGLCEGSSPSPAVLFLRKKDERGRFFDSYGMKGVEGLKQTYLGLGFGDISKLEEQYRKLFGEELPNILQTS